MIMKSILTQKSYTEFTVDKNRQLVTLFHFFVDRSRARIYICHSITGNVDVNESEWHRRWRRWQAYTIVRSFFERGVNMATIKRCLELNRLFRVKKEKQKKNGKRWAFHLNLLFQMRWIVMIGSHWNANTVFGGMLKNSLSSISASMRHPYIKNVSTFFALI